MAEVGAEAGSSSDPPVGSWEGVSAPSGVAVAPGIEAGSGPRGDPECERLLALGNRS